VTVLALDALATSTDAQFVSERNLGTPTTVMRSNFEGPASILAVLANLFEERGSGTLVGISPVAGARGRATPYTYGAAKAGFTASLSGLRNRLAKKGVDVVTVLPGFVAAKMTEGMELPASIFRSVGQKQLIPGDR
jgi:decaprenylphospho-beta-D-erythro-pentofuranosid-2-ulose 2-reductase